MAKESLPVGDGATDPAPDLPEATTPAPPAVLWAMAQRASLSTPEALAAEINREQSAGEMVICQTPRVFLNLQQMKKAIATNPEHPVALVFAKAIKPFVSSPVEYKKTFHVEKPDLDALLTGKFVLREIVVDDDGNRVEKKTLVDTPPPEPELPMVNPNIPTDLLALPEVTENKTQSQPAPTEQEDTENKTKTQTVTPATEEEGDHEPRSQFPNPVEELKESKIQNQTIFQPLIPDGPKTEPVSQRPGRTPEDPPSLIPASVDHEITTATDKAKEDQAKKDNRPKGEPVQHPKPPKAERPDKSKPPKEAKTTKKKKR